MFILNHTITLTMFYFVAPPNVKSTDSIKINMVVVPGKNILLVFLSVVLHQH